MVSKVPSVFEEDNSASNLELASKLTIINFLLSRAGLEDKFLSLFLSNERPELEDQKQMLMVQSASNQCQIRDLEDRILYVLSSSRGNILEDETATKTLYSSKGLSYITSEGISVKQKEIQKSEQEIDQVRESYRSVSSHAASLYSCIGQLRHLNKVYQFSLPWFLSLFTNAIVASQTSLSISERIVYVNEHFTRTLHHSICWALFNVDRQLFTVLLAFAALRSTSNVQQETIDRLYAEKPLPPSHWIGPSWIDNNS
ncbi:hypothetical protein DAPPUDRAFT_340573 [Daphnia pulex]|uniref:Dynein heavy chain ATP-binding dynein motor region domain-containing protein n=1 Tax=Daphnia pulex TaxID=6669 RepID=E9I4D9_DAPPU|nr:hypothetical protein DAPPUDRAFT_340573 [Daphnia pulex]|eukprot:EFX61141.1 hypothetical protein DAPPUDRAFT_340573 [Daphnia pulex]